MTNFSFRKQFNKNVRAIIKFGSKIMQDNYPEQMAKTFIVNIAPWIKTHVRANPTDHPEDHTKLSQTRLK